MSAKVETQVLSIIRRFLRDSGAERAAQAVSKEANLERDLGIGSLERAELFHRIEKAYGIQLPDALMIEANAVQDLVAAVKAAKPSKPLAHEEIPILEATHIDPASARTLIDVLKLYVEKEPERPHIYLQDEKGNEQIISYGHLYEMADKTAQGLVKKGLKVGETVAIMLPTSAEFFFAFFGILLAGGVPVPIYPPFRPDQIEEYAKREALILRNAGVRFLITFQRARALSMLLQAFIPSLLEVTTVQALMTTGIKLNDFVAEPSDPTLIQYTSGSTGDPKGVLLNHENLLANIRAYGKGIQIKATDVGVSWLPLYHDMGLIGSWFGSLYYGVPLTLLSPLTFLSRPERWLWAIHYHRATLSAGPNFAYELCLKKIDDATIEGLDLSSWRLAFNGAEMIYPNTMEKFAKRFAPYGFNEKAFMPVYGLAESSLALSFPPPDRGPKVDRIKRLPFEKEGRAEPITEDEKNYYEFVSCGKALDEHEIRIVDDNNNAVEARVVGRIQFRGPSSMQGYYRNPEATKAIYYNGWWDTGDLGYLADHELFITGRKKDLIIKAGRNYYPAEIEEIIGQAQGVRKGCVAAFGITDSKRGTEKLIIVAETNETDKFAFQEIRQAINEKIVSQLGIPPDDVVLVPPRTIPKTSSGKLRRSACKQDYLNQKLGQHGTPIKWQIMKLFCISAFKKITGWFGITGKLVYSFYMSIIVVITLTPTWLLVISSSRQKAARIARVWSRWILRFGFCPMTTKGMNHLSKNQPVIYVANHASYIDMVILMSVLPPDCCFVGKKELLKIPLFKSFIKHLEFITIDRLDFTKSKSDAKQIEQVLEDGRSVVVFPEGTFSYATGVRPFKSGAFKVAAETGRTINPISIRGARKILRGDSFLIKPAGITVTMCEPLKPEATDWNEVVRLREMARFEIAKYSGEQTIDLIFAGLPSERKRGE